MALPKGPFTAFAGMEVREETTKAEEWLDAWGVRADDALLHEPETSPYGGNVSLTDKNEVLVFERYNAGAPSLKFHMKRQSHEMMNDFMIKKRMTKRSLFGFTGEDTFGWTRTQRPSAPEKGTLVFVNVWRFGSEKQIEEFKALQAVHAKYCWDNEPDTLTYYGGVVTGPSARGPKVQKGDIFFVMECTNGEAAKKHIYDPVHVALGKKFQETGIVMESIWEPVYRNSGRGFMYKQGMPQANL